MAAYLISVCSHCDHVNMLLLAFSSKHYWDLKQSHRAAQLLSLRLEIKTEEAKVIMPKKGGQVLI